ncbi:hypothetical protein G7085_16930 [Tessaracoccus sp. HDW20]|uniref:hypothetical protein n=1 Tax=Tessaracoccus coleopterorum TaxID=2714950 RepID=UPI0018D3C253|nr:hypothetical protein [Tessaracoccus coleopterorum]NHB85706.1 hypothetical protein [Tessaracoccus coleopterorum]
MSLGRTFTIAILAALAAILSGCAVSISSDPTDPDRVTVETPVSAVVPEPSQEPGQEPGEEPAGAVEVEAQSAALDDYVALEASQIPKLLEQFDDLYSDIQITGEHPDLIRFTYTFTEPRDPVAAAAAFDALLDDLESVAHGQIFPTMELYGVVPTQRLRYTYHNPDGTILWSQDISSEGSG